MEDAKSGATYRDCVLAAIFSAKTRMGWREPINVNDPTAGARERLASEVDRVLAKINGENGAAARSIAATD